MTKTPTKAPASKAGASKTDDTGAKAEKAKASPKAAKSPPKGAHIDKPKAGHKANALQQPLQPSEDLAAVVGSGTMPRGQVVSKVWEYIKANKLQNPDDGREIIADEKLKRVFGKDRATMFEMNKFLAQHLK